MAYKHTGFDSSQKITTPEDTNAFAHGSRGVQRREGIYICKVVDLVDDRYEGYMYVQVIGEYYQGDKSTKASRQEYHRVRRATPYGGAYQYANATNSYGMSGHPPAPGSEVVCVFPNNSAVGIMLGVLPDITRNSSVPTNPGTFIDSESDVVGPTVDPSVKADGNMNKRPRGSGETVKPSEEFSELYRDTENHPGLGIDSLRGLSSSSQRRESPTNVFGFNTPGGHHFVMDDGTLPNSDYSLAPDKDRKGGLSNLVRLGSAGGAQILFHDGAGFIYIISQTGKSWIQMSQDGKIDIYAEDDVSMRTSNDFNLYCGGDFNLDADAINIKARKGDMAIETAQGEVNLHSNKDIKLTTDLNGHIKAKGNIRISTDGLIDLNGPQATEATKPTPNNLEINTSIKESITGRVPEAEPWGGHAEEQEMLPQPASPNAELTAKDIDMSKIKNNQQPNSSKGNVQGKGSQRNNPRNSQEKVDKFNENPNSVDEETRRMQTDFQPDNGKGRELPPQFNGRLGPT